MLPTELCRPSSSALAQRFPVLDGYFNPGGDGMHGERIDEHRGSAGHLGQRARPAGDNWTTCCHRLQYR